MIRIALVAIDARSGGSEAIYTYRAPLGIHVGDAYFVPLGTRIVLGYVVEINEVEEQELGFPVAKLRPLGTYVQGLGLPLSVLALTKYISKEYLCPFCQVLGSAIPSGSRKFIEMSWCLTNQGFDEPSLSITEQETVRVIKELGGKMSDTRATALSPNIQRALKRLNKAGILEKVLSLTPIKEQQKISGSFCLTPDVSKIELFLKREGKRKPAQAMVLMRLQGAAGTSFSSQEIRALTGATDQTLRALIHAGLLELTANEVVEIIPPPSLNSHQKVAIDAINKAIDSNKHLAFLLYGVTGSGKTEVYLSAAAETLRQGRQVLYLVPEIALTAQIIAQLRNRFGKNIAVLHSMLSPRERLETWMRIKRGEVPIVLGARSALFAPLQNIGLIIMDEEHEASYKQDVHPRYHTKQAALFLAKYFNAVLVLGSATPSIESFLDAKGGYLKLLELPERAVELARLPKIYIEDLTNNYKKSRPNIFTDLLHSKMDKTLSRGEQVILFLNRRAYAPFLMCRDCGQTFTCLHCAVSLSYHRNEGSLRCHHCDYRMDPPETCPGCTGSRVSPFGVGVERVEETVHELFPEVNVARLDRDIVKKKGALEEVFTLFRAGEIQVLVGTQMLAKGLDFPNVTLVGVIAADISLNIPDFRSSERTFQLLSQVAGRAGRGSSPGEVVIQTLNPDHPAIHFCQQHDYLGFYNSISPERAQSGYPPYRRLINIVLSSEHRQKVMNASTQLVGLLGSRSDLEVLGPVDCPLERLQTLWRRHLLLKLEPGSSLEWIGDLINQFKPTGVSCMVDVDPYSLM